jgi:hypothetical protein
VQVFDTPKYIKCEVYLNIKFMKKLIYGSLSIMFVIVTTFGCKKQKMISSEKENHLKTITLDTIPGLEKVGSILKFETIEDYINFVEDTLDTKWSRLEDFTITNGFENYFSQNTTSSINEDSLRMDEMFGKLLNKDGVIILADYAVKIDLSKQKVFITDEKNLQANYSDLITGSTSNKNVKSYSTNDDVIDIILNGVTFKCDGAASFNEWSEPIYDGFIGGNYAQFQAQYFKSGIYFSVRIRGRHYHGGTGLYTSSPSFSFEVSSFNPNSKAMRMKRRPCGSSHVTFHHGGLRQFQNSGLWSGAGTNQYVVFTAYEGSRALNGYRVWIRGYINGSLGHSNYIGREINSNF